MWNFQRGITNRSLIERLNHAPWWRHVVTDKDVFPAIRKNSLNVYYRGNSLAKVGLVKKNLVAEIHYKFLLPPKIKSPYIRFEDGKSNDMSRVCDQLTSNIDDLAAIKAASKPYSGVEKSGVHEILRQNPNIIDVEVGLLADPKRSIDEQQEPESEEIGFLVPEKKRTDRSVVRVDFAAIEPSTNKFTLVFFEAKHYSNPEIRAEGSTPPKVIAQLSEYRRLVKRYEAEITTSYRLVAQNLVELRGRNNVDQRICAVADTNAELRIDPDPRLVIFGYDTDQIEGAIGSTHIDKLKTLLAWRLLLKGDAKQFKNILSHV